MRSVRCTKRVTLWLRARRICSQPSQKMVEGVRIELFDYTWVECWVDGMKAAGRAPSTISKRVSGLARVMDWAMRRELVQLDKTR